MIDASSIGDMFVLYDRAVDELSAAIEAERAAVEAVRDVRERISNLQRSIDNILETRRNNPPWNTHWHNVKGQVKHEAR